VAGLGTAIAAVAVTVGAGLVFDRWLHLPNLSMIFLVPVIFCAVRVGLWPAIAASILSFLAFDFFFVEPVYEITISQPQEFVALLVFLIVAVIIGSLASRVREQSLNMRLRVDAARSLFEFSRKLSGAAKLDDVAWAATAHAQKALGAKIAVILLPEDGELRLASAWPPLDSLDVAEASAARWALEKEEPAGLADWHAAECALSVSSACDAARRGCCLRHRTQECERASLTAGRSHAHVPS